MLIPLTMTQGLVEGRNQRQVETEAQVARLTAAPQTLMGPFLVIPYTSEVKRTKKNEKTGEWQDVWEEIQQERCLVPRELEMEGRVQIDARRRGLYKTQVYRVTGPLKGCFSLEGQAGMPAGRNLRYGVPYLAMGITDPRGILNRMTLQMEGRTYPFLPGTRRTLPATGIHALLPDLDLAHGSAFTFEMNLELMGTRSLQLAPVAEETRVSLKGAWPAPSFEGGFAPVERAWSKDGFSAQWRIPSLSRDLDTLLRGGADAKAQHFGVAFIDPVNIYLQSERAVKYGFLFVMLTFGAFLLREALRALPIHPVQYLLVGAALAIFFLLLLSLSEHLGFPWAYAVATASNLALLGTYLTGALRSRSEGLLFTGGLALLYAVLYGLLASEDNALLLGSVLLFALLGGLMLGTRRRDWRRSPEPAGSPLVPKDRG
ncbi:cell envelope integrity protein CreD [Mesoterricola silvestris]|uniref:Cell envelope integrity protein CreD n=2 Tax=Mesoterricola silvestris TaxID=2927979 RepID=A0AA48GSY1_9BACT|nr:cell envelope integrity protein CreD [Mesoterricola silvestris]